MKGVFEGTTDVRQPYTQAVDKMQDSFHWRGYSGFTRIILWKGASSGCLAELVSTRGKRLDLIGQTTASLEALFEISTFECIVSVNNRGE